MIRRLQWAVVPLLALLAYGAALRVGFLSDDFLLLSTGRGSGISLSYFQPDPNWFFYRPLGMLLTWGLGWTLWGYNALPFHVVGLLLHAGSALWLGLAVAEMSRRRGLGWLTGALFAVFPLHLEAVGWLAAQWDLWAAFFGLLSLWLFVRWWQASGQRALYVGALAAFTAGVFAKESLVTFPAIFVLAAWLVEPRVTPAALRRVALAVTPFVLVLLFNLSLRLLTWGNIGGYAGAHLDPDHLWDQLLLYARPLVAPVSAVVFGLLPVQIVGLITSVVLLVGIAWFGRAYGRLILVGAVWALLAILPVLNLGFGADMLTNNRFFYIAAGGYCLIVAALIYATYMAARRLRPLVGAIVAVILLLGIGASWAQLQPWHTATVQTQEIGDELTRLIPPQHSDIGYTWYVQDVPDSYKGAYVLRLGLGNLRFYAVGEPTGIAEVVDATAAPLALQPANTFALRFFYDEQQERYHVRYAAGITGAAVPPAPQASAARSLLWDFSNCDRGAIAAWQLVGVSQSCAPGVGLTLHPSNDDPQLQAPDLKLPVDAGVRFARLRVAVTYPQSLRIDQPVNEWFWDGADDPSFDPSRINGMAVKTDGQQHIYWTFIPADKLGGMLKALRFDPINGGGDSTIQWIALDLVG